MTSINTSSAYPDQEAANIINQAWEQAQEQGTPSPEQVQTMIRQKMEVVQAATRVQLHQYLRGMKDATKRMTVEKLDDGIGGQLDDGGVKMAVSTLEVHENVATTIKQMQEVHEHEMFHNLNNHRDPLKTAATEQDTNTLVLGGTSFKTDTPVVEAWTVKNTGNKFVSPLYRQYEKDLMSAASAAGVGMEELHQAIDEKKDLTLIDDRTREKSEADVATPMAA